MPQVLSEERKAELVSLLSTPRKAPSELTSLERLLRVNQYQEMMNNGIEVPEEHLSYAVELLTVDRTERQASVKKDRKIAKDTGAEPMAEDL